MMTCVFVCLEQIDADMESNYVPAITTFIDAFYSIIVRNCQIIGCMVIYLK